MDRQIYRLIYKKKDIQIYIKKDKQIDRQKDKQIESQIDRKIYRIQIEIDIQVDICPVHIDT